MSSRFFLLLVLFASEICFGTSSFIGFEQTLKNLQLRELYNTKKSLTPLKVAIFDKGFRDYKKSLGKSLPSNLQYHSGPGTEEENENQSEHGRIMAEIFYETLTNQGSISTFNETELHLYNVQGFTRFKTAIDNAIESQIDVIVYSEVWEIGGNGDGRGFINHYVEKAIDAGITWINAAGNFNNRIYKTKIVTDDQDWVDLPDTNNAFEVQCHPKGNAETCHLRVVLIWNDFKNNEDYGTSKDLDLFLTDDTLSIIERSALKQTEDLALSRQIPTYSLYPREAIETELSRGQTYYIRVKDRSQNFRSYDWLKILVSGDFIITPSGQNDGSLLNPADHPDVIAVGASDSEISSISTKLNKPELKAPSRIVFAEDDKEYRGSSNSTAIFGAIATMIKSIYSDLSRNELLLKLKKFSTDRDSSAIENDPGFGPFRDCYYPLKGSWPEYFAPALDAGGVVVETTIGLAIMLPFDPFDLIDNAERASSTQRVFLSSRGFHIVSKSQPQPLRSIQLFARPSNQWECD